MRADLNKQLCERERRGSKMRYKEVRRSKKFSDVGEEGEGLVAHESMTYRYGYDTKDFNENLNPLYSQIRKALGRPWDKFYSELCANFDMRSVINDHIVQHLYDRITVNLVMKDGELWEHPKYGGPRRFSEDTSSEYYVDPRDGIIKKNKNYHSYRQGRKQRALDAEKELALVEHWVDDHTVLRKIEDIWFEFTTAPVPPARIVFEKPLNKDTFQTGWRATGKEKAWDQLTEIERAKFGIKRLVGEMVYDAFKDERISGADRYNRAPKYYHVTKRTASNKTLRKAGLVV